MKIQGMGDDAPTITSDSGGKQSLLPYRLDLIPPEAVFRMGDILKAGAEKYGEDNWRDVPHRDHLNHALCHIYAHLAGDEQGDHLGSALCRLTFAVATENEMDPDEKCSYCAGSNRSGGEEAGGLMQPYSSKECGNIIYAFPAYCTCSLHRAQREASAWPVYGTWTDKLHFGDRLHSPRCDECVWHQDVLCNDAHEAGTFPLVISEA